MLDEIGAPQSMKMDNTHSSWRYDAAPSDALRSVKLRRHAIAHYDSPKSGGPHAELVRSVDAVAPAQVKKDWPQSAPIIHLEQHRIHPGQDGAECDCSGPHCSCYGFHRGLHVDPLARH